MSSSIINLIKYWRKHGWVKTKKDWTYKFMILDTPDQILTKELYGLVGMLGALVFAFVTSLYSRSWAIAAVFLCATWLSWISLKSKIMQRKQLREMTEEFRRSE